MQELLFTCCQIKELNCDYVKLGKMIINNLLFDYKYVEQIISEAQWKLMFYISNELYIHMLNTPRTQLGIAVIYICMVELAWIIHHP